MSLYRATTPRHTFVFDIDPEENFKTILVSYEQDEAILLEKDKSDMVFATEQDDKGNISYTGTVTLTQEEANLFLADPKKPVNLQVRVVTTGGAVLASDVYAMEVKRVLNDEVLTCD